MHRILIIRMGSLGDIVHTLPAAATLRRAFPDAEIGWVVERHWSPLVARNPHLNHVHFVETKRWRKQLAEAGTWRSLMESVAALRGRRYTIALDFQGLLKSAVLARLSDAETVVGFDRSELREKAAGVFYSRRVSPPASARHVVERNLALVAAVGAREPVLEFCCPADESDAERMHAATEPLGKYAVLSPSAGWPAKQWPPESFAALATRIAGELGFAVIIQCGPGDEAIAERVAAVAGGAARVMRPSLGELIPLMSGAALVVAGDTGPLHLAAATRRPVVGIFGPTDPERNGPYGPRCRVVRAAGAVTDYSRSATQEAIRRVSVEQVFEAIRELLNSR